MRPVDPATISEACKKRAAELGVNPIAYRRWERGEKIPEVRDAIDAEDYRKQQSAANAEDPHSG